MRLGRAEESAQRFFSVSTKANKLFGAAHPLTRKSQYLLGQAQTDAGDYVAAESTFSDLMKSPRDEHDRANLHWRLGMVFMNSDRPKPAAERFRSAIELFAKVAPDKWHIADAKSRLGAALYSLGQVDKGRSMMLEGDKLLRERSNLITAGLREVILSESASRLAQSNVKFGS